MFTTEKGHHIRQAPNAQWRLDGDNRVYDDQQCLGAGKYYTARSYWSGYGSAQQPENYDSRQHGALGKYRVLLHQLASDPTRFAVTTGNGEDHLPRCDEFSLSSIAALQILIDESLKFIGNRCDAWLGEHGGSAFCLSDLHKRLLEEKIEKAFGPLLKGELPVDGTFVPVTADELKQRFAESGAPFNTAGHFRFDAVHVKRPIKRFGGALGLVSSKGIFDEEDVDANGVAWNDRALKELPVFGLTAAHVVNGPKHYGVDQSLEVGFGPFGDPDTTYHPTPLIVLHNEYDPKNFGPYHKNELTLFVVEGLGLDQQGAPLEFEKKMDRKSTYTAISGGNPRNGTPSIWEITRVGSFQGNMLSAIAHLRTARPNDSGATVRDSRGYAMAVYTSTIGQLETAGLQSIPGNRDFFQCAVKYALQWRKDHPEGSTRSVQMEYNICPE